MADSPTPVAAKSYLLDALRALPSLDGVQVSWAHPGKGIKREALFFMDTTPYEQRGKSLGNHTRQETYTLELVVTVSLRGNDPEACERRCWELLAAVSGLLQTSDTLGESVRVAEYRSGPVKNYSGAQERVSECVVNIDVEAEVKL